MGFFVFVGLSVGISVGSAVCTGLSVLDCVGALLVISNGVLTGALVGVVVMGAFEGVILG